MFFWQHLGSIFLGDSFFLSIFFPTRTWQSFFPNPLHLYSWKFRVQPSLHPRRVLWATLLVPFPQVFCVLNLAATFSATSTVSSRSSVATMQTCWCPLKHNADLTCCNILQTYHLCTLLQLGIQIYESVYFEKELACGYPSSILYHPKLSLQGVWR